MSSAGGVTSGFSSSTGGSGLVSSVGGVTSGFSSSTGGCGLVSSVGGVTSGLLSSTGGCGLVSSVGGVTSGLLSSTGGCCVITSIGVPGFTLFTSTFTGVESLLVVTLSFPSASIVIFSISNISAPDVSLTVPQSITSLITISPVFSIFILSLTLTIPISVVLFSLLTAIINWSSFPGTNLTSFTSV